MTDTDPGRVFGELVPAIADDVLTIPDLVDGAWDAFAMVAEVSDDRIAVSAYRCEGGAATG